MDNLIGKRLDGRYQIEQLVGTGGMANVYKALDLKENRVVAVKILREEFLTNEELVTRFKNESKAIAVLNHPNIVKVYDISVSEKMQFIVMEYIDGITLREYMDERNEPLTYKETLFFVCQTLKALGHAHEKGVVHRDIKPQNIMLLPDGSIRVMDFGIARLSRAQGSIISNKAIGSVHYISPEQAKGDNTDAAADIYSVGVMMYEMLSGKLPFESDTPVSVAIKQISDIATPLCKINANIPSALESITQKAMAKDPRQRYQSTPKMIDDIEEFKQNPSIKFDYKYLTDPTQVRNIDKIVNSQKSGTKSARGNNSAQKAKKKKHHYGLPILAGMAVAFAIGATILVFMIFKLSGNPLFNDKNDVDLMDFVGLNVAQVKKDSSLKKLYNFKYEEKYNDYKETGVIYDQFPKSGKKVKEGATVTLRISKGVEMVNVPDIVNDEKDAGGEKLKSAGFHIVFRREVNDKVPIGKVVRTEPAAGEQTKAGSSIVVFVSQPKIDPNTKVPTLVGVSTVEEATMLISKSQLTLGTIAHQESDLPAGTIIEQSPAPEAEVKKGSSVNIVFSDGWTERTRVITVSFDATINEGVWTAVCDGVTNTFATQNGVATTWSLSFTGSGSGEKLVTIAGPNATKDVSINFTSSGADQEVKFGGTFVASTTRTITVTFDATINGGAWTAAADGIVLSTFTTKDGVASTWTFPATLSGKKAISISGPSGSKNVDVDFTSLGADAATSFGGTYKPPAPPVSSTPAPPTPTPTPPVTSVPTPPAA